MLEFDATESETTIEEEAELPADEPPVQADAPADDFDDEEVKVEVVMLSCSHICSLLLVVDCYLVFHANVFEIKNIPSIYFICIVSSVILYRQRMKILMSLTRMSLRQHQESQMVPRSLKKRQKKIS